MVKNENEALKARIRELEREVAVRGPSSSTTSRAGSTVSFISGSGRSGRGREDGGGDAADVVNVGESAASAARG